MSQKDIAVYPGSFDPITRGHVDIVQRMAPLFDDFVVLISQASEKQSLFSPPERKKLAGDILKNLKNVTVEISSGLTVDFLKKIGAKYIIRGLRSEADLNHEWVVANMNKDLFPKVETLLIFGRPEMSHISSRAVKEVALHGGDLSAWVDSTVQKAIQKKLKEVRK